MNKAQGRAFNILQYIQRKLFFPFASSLRNFLDFIHLTHSNTNFLRKN